MVLSWFIQIYQVKMVQMHAEHVGHCITLADADLFEVIYILHFTLSKYREFKGE